MIKWFNDLLNSESAKSSARFINILVGVGLIGVFVSDFIRNGEINIDAMIILAMYGGGVYGTSGAINWAKGKLEVQNAKPSE